MGIGMYVYKVEKPIIFETFRRVGDYYNKHHSSKIYLDNAYTECKTNEDLATKSKEMQDAIRDKAFEELFGEVHIQIFDYTDTTFLIRVCENGYMFMNNFRQMGLNITPCFYDDRGDMDTDMIENKEMYIQMFDWLDERIKMKEYFMFPIIDMGTIKQFLYESFKKRLRELR